MSRIIVLNGDGIGPEIVSASVALLEKLSDTHQLGLQFEYDDVGFASLEKHGTTVAPGLLEKCREFDGIILGPQSNMDYPPKEEGGLNISATFRTGLDLYANVRPARTRPGVGNGKPGMDLVIMREATEGFYADRNMHMGIGEMMPDPNMALSIRKITAHCCERIARRAFELARTRRKKVTAVHKINCFIMTDGLFMREVDKVAKEYPDVEYDNFLVDAMAAYLVRHPQNFDVIVSTNFYSDILSDLASELSGSIGLAGSIMASDDCCAAQAQHGSAPDIEGQDKANPTSMALSCAMLLEWMGAKQNKPELSKAGAALSDAIDKTLDNPETRTADLGGSLGCKAFGEAIAANL